MTSKVCCEIHFRNYYYYIYVILNIKQKISTRFDKFHLFWELEKWANYFQWNKNLIARSNKWIIIVGSWKRTLFYLNIFSIRCCYLIFNYSFLLLFIYVVVEKTQYLKFLLKFFYQIETCWQYNLIVNNSHLSENS